MKYFSCIFIGLLLLSDVLGFSLPGPVDLVNQDGLGLAVNDGKLKITFSKTRQKSPGRW